MFAYVVHAIETLSNEIRKPWSDMWIFKEKAILSKSIYRIVHGLVIRSHAMSDPGI